MNTTPPCEICHFHHDKDEFMSFSVTHPVLQVSSHQLNTTSSILEESYVDIGRKRKSREKNNERRQKRRQEWLLKYQRGSRKFSEIPFRGREKKSLVLCDNCANALEKKLRRDIEDARKILQMYEKYDSDKITNSNTTTTMNPDVDEKIRHQKSHRRNLPRYDESQRVNQLRFVRRKAEAACRDADEFHDRQVDERDRLLRKLENVKRETQRFKSFSALSDVCNIWYDNDFGKISSFRLGTTRLEHVVPTAEINAACGQVIVLLLALAKRVRVEFSNCQLIDLGSKSCVMRRSGGQKAQDLSESYTMVQTTKQKSNLYLCDERFENAHDVASFNRAIRCVCDCVEEIASRVRDPLPHPIKSGLISDVPVVIPIHGDDNRRAVSYEEKALAQWSKAMRFLLVDLKFLQLKTINY